MNENSSIQSMKHLQSTIKMNGLTSWMEHVGLTYATYIIIPYILLHIFNSIVYGIGVKSTIENFALVF